MCFWIRILSLFHLTTQIVSNQNLNCPKNAKNACADMIFIPAFLTCKDILIPCESFWPELSNDVYQGGVNIWSKSVKMRISSKKLPEKNSFFEYHDSGSTDFGGGWTPNFKSTDIFDMFPENFGAKAFRWAIGKPAGVNIVRTAGCYFAQGGATRKIAKKWIFCFFRFSSKILWRKILPG